MKRGDVVIVVTAGDYGKPRPAVIIQSDAFEPLHSVTILPLTSANGDEHLVRITLEPTEANGLRARSQIMIDKVTTVHRTKVGAVIGRAGPDTMQAVSVALSRFLGVG